jgi:hypothetical protein
LKDGVGDTLNTNEHPCHLAKRHLRMMAACRRVQNIH